MLKVNGVKNFPHELINERFCFYLFGLNLLNAFHTDYSALSLNIID